MNTVRYRTILRLALPIMGAMLSQNVLNLVDTAMVGVLGPVALAAVGIGGFATFVGTAVVIGLASGVQIMVARRKGEGRESEIAVPLNGGLLLALAAGVPLSVALLLLAPAIFPVLIGDADVIGQGVPYFQARLWGILAVGMNFAFRGYWTGINRPGLYMRTLLIVHGCNVAISYVLIFGKLGMPQMGTLGAGIGTTVSLFIGSGIYVLLGWRHARQGGFLRRLPDLGAMAVMVRLAVPSAVQQFLFAAGFMVFFWIIGQVGTAELATATVLVNLVLVAVLPAIGLGLAATSLVGQALGRGDAADAGRWGWDVCRLAALLIGAIGLVGIALPDVLLSAFLHDPALLDLGRAPLILTGVLIAADAVGIVLLQALLGAGDAARMMVVAVTAQWIIGLPAAWFAGPYLGLGLFWVWATFEGYRVLQSLVFAGLWTRGRWALIRV